MGLRTQLEHTDYAPDAGGANVSVSATPVTLTTPTAVSAYPTTVWVFSVAPGVTETVFVTPNGSSATTSGIAITGGQSVQYGPVLSTLPPRIVATGATTLRVSVFGVRGEA